MKDHFLSLSHRDVTLSNGWIATLRELSGAEKLRLDAMMMDVTYAKGKANVTPRFERQGQVYCEAISMTLVKLKDGDNEIEGLSVEDAGRLPQSAFNGLRDAIDEMAGGSEGN